MSNHHASLSTMAPDTIRHVLSFCDSSHDTVCAARRVCRNWAAALSTAALQMSGGLQAVHLTNLVGWVGAHDDNARLVTASIVGARTTRLTGHVTQEVANHCWAQDQQIDSVDIHTSTTLALDFTRLRSVAIHSDDTHCIVAPSSHACTSITISGHVDMRQLASLLTHHPDTLHSIDIMDARIDNTVAVGGARRAHAGTSSIAGVIAGACTRLRSIKMGWANFQSSASDLAKLFRANPELTTIELAGVHAVDNSVLESIAETCRGVQHIKLDACGSVSFHDGIRQIARNCHELRSISIEHCATIGIGAIDTLIECCPKLENLSLERNATLLHFDWFIPTIAPRMPNLVALNLRGCSPLSPVSVTVLARNCRNLEQIDLSYCTGLQPEAIMSLTYYCARLRVVLLGHSTVSDDAIEYLVTHCPTLENLGVAKCHQLAAQTFVQIGRACTRLRILDARNTLIDSCGMRAIAEGCRRLRVLYVNGCARVTDAAVGMVARGCAELAVLDVFDCEQLSDATNRIFDRHRHIVRAAVVHRQIDTHFVKTMRIGHCGIISD